MAGGRRVVEGDAVVTAAVEAELVLAGVPGPLAAAAASLGCAVGDVVRDGRGWRLVFPGCRRTSVEVLAFPPVGVYRDWHVVIWDEEFQVIGLREPWRASSALCGWVRECGDGGLCGALRSARGVVRRVCGWRPPRRPPVGQGVLW